MIVREPLSFLASQDHSVVSSHDNGVHCAMCNYMFGFSGCDFRIRLILSSSNYLIVSDS